MLNFPTKVVAFSFFEPMSEKAAKRDGAKGLERREDMIRRNYFTGIRYTYASEQAYLAILNYRRTKNLLRAFPRAVTINNLFDGFLKKEAGHKHKVPFLQAILQ